MKIILKTVAFAICTTSAFAQPLGTPPAYANNPNQAVKNANFAWYRGGNSLGGPAGGNNIFGTMWNSSVYHYTNGKRRMTLFDDTYTGASTSTPFGGGLTINLDPANPVVQPFSLLTIGDNVSPGGWRNWMKVGTFNNLGSDNMYIGLKNEGGSDRQDAVINWGDNTTTGGSIYGPDYLRFIFTAPQFAGYPGAAGTQNGLETMRINFIGHIGVGNYYNNAIEAPFSKNPARRFEILSDKTAVGNNGNALLRLTHTQQDPSSLITLTNTGLFSEFQPMNTGDLFIDTRNNTLTNTNTTLRNFNERFIGINTNAPGNTMEINSQLVSATTTNGVAGYPTGNATGWAGLRFTDLKSSSVPQTNPSTNVLSVDANGDVILVNVNSNGGGSANADNGLSTNGITAGAIHLGQNPGTVGNPGQLLSDREIPMNGKSILFTALNQTTGLERIEIGTNYNTVIGSNSKLVVVENVANDPVTISNAIEAINADNTNSPLTEKNGIKALSTGTNPNKGSNNGGLFIGNNAAYFNRGVVGIASSNQSVATAVGQSFSHIGGLFIADNSTGGNCGIYVQSNTLSSDYAGWFDGNVNINGAGTIPGGVWGLSDQMFKTHIDTITHALNIIHALKPKQFYYDTTNAYGLNFSSKKQYGLIAQEVEQILPEIVGKAHQSAKLDNAGNIVVQATDYKTVNYNALFGILIKAMQEQQSKIDSLTTKLNSKDSLQDARLTAIENAMAQCCSNASARSANSTTNSLDIELSDKDAIVLNQNVPNPFAEQTTITYNVPEKVGKAQILFFNAAGQIIQTVDVKTRGKGKINVFASDLSSGLYHYSLVADGVIIDSKKMVRE